MTTKKKILTGIAGALFAVVAAGYGAAAYYYSNHFYSHTEINGTDYGEMTVQEVKDKITEQLPSYYNKRTKRSGRDTDRTAVTADLSG